MTLKGSVFLMISTMGLCHTIYSADGFAYTTVEKYKNTHKGQPIRAIDIVQAWNKEYLGLNPVSKKNMYNEYLGFLASAGIGKVDPRWKDNKGIYQKSCLDLLYALTKDGIVKDILTDITNKVKTLGIEEKFKALDPKKQLAHNSILTTYVKTAEAFKSDALEAQKKDTLDIITASGAFLAGIVESTRTAEEADKKPNIVVLSEFVAKEKGKDSIEKEVRYKKFIGAAIEFDNVLSPEDGSVEKKGFKSILDASGINALPNDKTKIISQALVPLLTKEPILDSDPESIIDFAMKVANFELQKDELLQRGNQFFDWIDQLKAKNDTLKSMDFFPNSKKFFTGLSLFFNKDCSIDILNSIYPYVEKAWEAKLLTPQAKLLIKNQSKQLINQMIDMLETWIEKFSTLIPEAKRADNKFFKTLTQSALNITDALSLEGDKTSIGLDFLKRWHDKSATAFPSFEQKINILNHVKFLPSLTTAIKSIFSVIKENVEKTEYQEGIGDETTTYNVKNSYTDHLFFLLLSGKNKDEIVKKIIGNYVVRPNPDDYKDDLAAYIKASKKFEEENPYFFVNEDQGNLYFKSIRDDVAPGAAVKTISDAVDTFLKQLQEIKMS